MRERALVACVVEAFKGFVLSAQRWQRKLGGCAFVPDCLVTLTGNGVRWCRWIGWRTPMQRTEAFYATGSAAIDALSLRRVLSVEESRNAASRQSDEAFSSSIAKRSSQSLWMAAICTVSTAGPHGSCRKSGMDVQASAAAPASISGTPAPRTVKADFSSLKRSGTSLAAMPVM